MKSPSPGIRTFAFGLAALAFLLVGLALGLSWPAAVGALWAPYVAGVCTIFLGVAGKHSVETLAAGTGVAGAMAALMTSAAPEPKP